MKGTLYFEASYPLGLPVDPAWEALLAWDFSMPKIGGIDTGHGGLWYRNTVAHQVVPLWGAGAPKGNGRLGAAVGY